MEKKEPVECKTNYIGSMAGNGVSIYYTFIAWIWSLSNCFWVNKYSSFYLFFNKDHYYYGPIKKETKQNLLDKW